MQPAASWNLPAACAAVVASEATHAPLSISARENSPCASGLATSRQVSTAPADSPNTNSRFGSPPNLAMFVCTQRSAAIWSRRP